METGKSIGSTWEITSYHDFEPVNIGLFAQLIRDDKVIPLNGKGNPIIAGVVISSIPTKEWRPEHLPEVPATISDALLIKRTGIVTVTTVPWVKIEEFDNIYVSNQGDKYDGMATNVNTEGNILLKEHFYKQCDTNVWKIKLKD